jgi:hypothetical protein
MKLFSTLIIALVLSSFSGFAQTSTIILQPDAADGKDAFIESRLNDYNRGNHPDFAAISWTYSGTHTDGRCLIEFDLSMIPQGSTIDSARISFYAYNSPSNGSHSKISGSNESMLSRVTSSWEEDLVTWNNQPTISTKNQIYLAETTHESQDYLDIDITSHIQAMFENPDENHGFMLKLITEEHYRSMIFASSDNEDASLRPKLEITFTAGPPLPADTCVILQPAEKLGKDAFIQSRLSGNNAGYHSDFIASSWTYNGVPCDVRSLIDFDLSFVPADAIINSAYLSLYSYTSSANGSHSNMSGSNESVLSRVTSPWDENTVTWNNQPSTTNQNELILAKSVEEIQDYENMDVTSLLRDMVGNPYESYGFLFKLKTEERYRSMIFASSDYEDANLHPKLKVCYSKNTSTVREIKLNTTFEIYPNPATNKITLDLSNIQKNQFSIEIINSSGQVIYSQNNHSPLTEIDLNHLAIGLYFVRVYSSDFVITKRLILE